MATQPKPALLVLYASIIEWRKGTPAQKRAMFEQFIAYCAKVGAKPAFCLVDWSFDEVPTLGKEAWEARSFADVYGVQLYWGRRLFCQKTAIQRPKLLEEVCYADYYLTWASKLADEALRLSCESAGDTEPYNSLENYMDAYQDETPISLGSVISTACKSAINTAPVVDLMMPFGSAAADKNGNSRALQYAFGPLSGPTGLQANNWYRYPESIPPVLPPFFQWANQISYSHLSPTKVAVSSVLNTWTPAEWHQGWTTETRNRPVMNQRMIYTASWGDLQAVVAALAAL